MITITNLLQVRCRHQLELGFRRVQNGICLQATSQLETHACGLCQALLESSLDRTPSYPDRLLCSDCCCVTGRRLAAVSVETQPSGHSAPDELGRRNDDWGVATAPAPPRC